VGGDDGRPAGLRPHIEGAAEKTDAFRHTEQPEPAAPRFSHERALDLEAPSVVGYLDPHAAGILRHDDTRRLGPAMDAYVGESFLDHTHDRDALRRRDALRQAAAELQAAHDAVAAPDVLHLVREHLLQRALEQAGRLERSDDLTQVCVECEQPRLEVVDPAEDRRLPHTILERVAQVPVEEPHLAQQREDILRGTIVHVEGQTREPALGSLHDHLQALLARSEQRRAFKGVGDDPSRLEGQRARELAAAGRRTKDDRPDGMVVPHDRHTLDRTLPLRFPLRADDVLRVLARAPARRVLAACRDAAHAIAQLDGPDRHGVEARNELERRDLPADRLLMGKLEQAEIPQGDRPEDQAARVVVHTGLPEGIERDADRAVAGHVM
jgi:hypothetical protein